MKKTITILMVLAVLAALFAGCAQTGKETGTASVSASVSAEETMSSTPAGQTIKQPSSSVQAGSSGALTDMINAAKNMTSLTCDFSVTISGSELVGGTMWYEAAKKLKIKTAVNSVDVVEIIDLADKTMVIYMPSAKTGTKTAMTADVDTTNPGNYLAGLDMSKLKDLGTETVNGYNCRIVEYPDPSDSTSDIKMWISTETSFPTRITVKTGDNEVEMNYTNISTAALPAGTFDIPSDITITENK